MKRSFTCSIICQGGIMGGWISIDDKSVTYKTNKLTVDRKYRNLVLSIDEIRELSWRWIVATIDMANGEQYKLMIFNKKGFSQCFEEVKKL